MELWMRDLIPMVTVCGDCIDTEECDGLDNDGDGIVDEGFDSDGDGIADCYDTEECDGLDNDGDGIVDEGFDSDGDGIADCYDTEECDGLDNDGDGIVDEGFDSDGDGIGDCIDGCPNDPDKTNPGICGCGVPDTDSDDDGTPDCDDGCINDPFKIDPGTCGCGCISDIDFDIDGVPDIVDNCTNVYNPGQEDSDGDGIGDACQPPVINNCVTNDVIFVMDASGSVGQEGWDLEKQFVSELLDSLDGGAGGIRFGVVRFGTSATIAYYLDSDQNIDAIQSAVNGLSWIQGRSSTREGLERAIYLLQDLSLPENNHHIILITADKPRPNCRQNPCVVDPECSYSIEAAAVRDDLSSLNIKMTIVAIGTDWNASILSCLVGR